METYIHPSGGTPYAITLWMYADAIHAVSVSQKTTISEYTELCRKIRLNLKRQCETFRCHTRSRNGEGIIYTLDDM